MGRLSLEAGGFVLVDALVAVALIGSAGTVVYMIGHGMLQQQDERLDRSVAFANLDAIAKEAVLLGAPQPGVVREDESYSYVVATSASPSRELVALVIEAVPRDGGMPIVVSALVPAAQ
jgi:hypothetical protein